MKNRKIDDLQDTPAKVTKERNPLDWLSTPDVVQDILNSLACIYYHKGKKELRKANPSQDRIEELAALLKEAREACNDIENYSSLDRMDDVIAHYAPILKEIRLTPLDPKDVEMTIARALELFNEGEISKENYEYIMNAYNS